MEQPCDIVILAAGSSARLGSPKQLLPYKQATLIKHSVKIALDSQAQRVVVVLGANAESIQSHIEHAKLFFVLNDQWQEGIASSIRAGLNYLLEQEPAAVNVLFMVCDQPYITTALLDKLITLQQETGQPIAASEYGGVIGIPAIFAKQLFPALLKLEGDTGAKKLMMQHQENVALVNFPMGEIDIDTAADYQQLDKT